jgi:RNA polymerase sigma factor (sigma-70 family)
MHRTRRSISLAEDRIRRVFEAGRREHGGLDLPFERFAACARKALPRIDNGDYYLAVACDQGTAGAWERLHERFRRPLAAMMRRRGAVRSDVERLLDEMWGRLAAPPARGAARTRIGTFTGRGPLLAWLATVAWRHLTDEWRARAGVGPLCGQDDPAPGAWADPALSLEQEESARAVGKVLERTWSALTLRELEVIVLKYRHRLPQVEVARVMGISPARVTRLNQSAVRRLCKAVRRHATRLPADAPQAELVQVLQRLLARTDVEMRGDARRGRGAG